MKFHKMSGAGNDFVLIESRWSKAFVLRKLAVRLCDRRRGVGADGLLVAGKGKAPNSIKILYFNSDGSEAFCGNGARCAAWWAYSCGLVRSKRFFLETAAGRLECRIAGRETVRLRMPDVSGVKLFRAGRFPKPVREVHFLNTGVPHAVVPVRGLEKVDVNSLGRRLRCSRIFGRAGANVDFVSLKRKILFIRTYERGVEAETPACGTGVVASAIALGLSGALKSPVTCMTRSGERFTVWFEPRGKASARNIYVQGPARIVFTGRFYV